LDEGGAQARRTGSDAFSRMELNHAADPIQGSAGGGAAQSYSVANLRKGAEIQWNTWRADDALDLDVTLDTHGPARFA
jgi:hypothetical protein